MLRKEIKERNKSIVKEKKTTSEGATKRMDTAKNSSNVMEDNHEEIT